MDEISSNLVNNRSLQSINDDVRMVTSTMKSYNSSDYYDPIYQMVTLISFGSLSLVGIVGNLMVVAVVLTVRGMMSPTNCYLVSLAIADSLFFISTMPTEIANMVLPKNVYAFGQIGCSILSFLPYLSLNSSSLSITAFTIERYIAICHPMKAQYICTIKRAKIIIIAVWCFSLMYNSSWLFLVQVKPSGQCTFRLHRDSYIYIYFADMLLFYWIPLILYFVLYGKMTYILLKANFTTAAAAVANDEKTTATKNNLRRFSKQTSADALAPNAAENLLTTPHNCSNLNSKRHSSCSGQYSTSSASKPIGISANKSRFQVVKMLVVIVCTFAALWLPYRGLMVYNSFASKKYVNIWYLLFAKTMIFVNCAINPILYNVMSAKYRRSFKLMFAQIGFNCRYYELYSSSRTFMSSAGSRRPIRRRSTKHSQIAHHQENGYKNEPKLLQGHDTTPITVKRSDV